MCEDCYDIEHKSFPNEKIWLDFDLELTKKLGKSKMKYVKFNRNGARDKDDGKYVYKCNSYKQRWKLKEPDYSFRGYFLKV